MSSKVKVLRSTVAGKRPTGHEFGELWVNHADKVMGYIDSAGQPVVPFALPSDIVIHKFDPAKAYVGGDVVLGPDGTLYSAKAAVTAGAWNAAQWNPSGYTHYVDVAGDTMTGALTLSGAPTVDLHAATKKYVDDADALAVLKAGDTMTGPLVLPAAAPTADAQAANKKYVDDKAAAAKTQADTDYVNVAGDTMTGALNLPADGLTVGGTQVVVKNGNLGLGVTPSAWQSIYRALEVGAAGHSFFSTTATGVGHPNNTLLTQNAYFDGSWRYGYSSVAAAHYEIQNGNHRWYTAPSGTANDPITFTEAMTLNAGGNLAVGITNNPNNRRVRINGTGSGATWLSITDEGQTSNEVFVGLDPSTSLAYFGTSAWGVGFSTGSTERARITSDGNLLVGVTTAVAGEKFLVAGSITNYISRIYNYHTAPHGIAIVYPNASPNNTTNEVLAFQDSTTTRFKIQSNGGIANFQANNVSLSDRREKTNFAPAESYLDKICAIPVQTFNYIGQNLEDDSGTTLGVVAQDVQAVAPELVVESDWGTEDNPKMRLSIYQTDLQYALMKCIQEQQAIIQDLTNRIAALEPER